MKGLAAFSGERLTQAREARGLTKVSLSQMVEISSTALSDLESNRTKPRAETLERLSEVMSFSAEFFLRPVKVSAKNHIFWRRQASEPLRSQEKTRQRLSWALEGISLIEEMVILPIVALPFTSNLPRHWSAISDEQIELLAERCREDWGLGHHPIPDMILALENIGIPVISFDIENAKQSGYMYWSDELSRPIIGNNTLECSHAKQRFNVAHEFGHVLLHRSATTSEVRNTTQYREMERQAHRFAGALLFPRKAFYREVKYPSLEEFEVHKHERGISIFAQIIRAEQLGLCSADYALGLKMKASKKGFRRPLGEPLDEGKGLELPRMLRRAIDAIEGASELVLAMLRNSLQLPKGEEVALFGRPLTAIESNVVQLRFVK